jgi:hypothetical protein
MTQLFEPADQGAPRLFATSLGVDFCAALIEGLDARLAGQPPEAIARVEILVANARMLRRLQALYLRGGPASCRACGPSRGCRTCRTLPGSTPRCRRCGCA